MAAVTSGGGGAAVVTTWGIASNVNRQEPAVSTGKMGV